jgi:hypothetical protein
MKMKPEHYAHMLKAIRPLAPKIASHRAWLLSDGRARDTEKRLRWDLSYAAKLSPWICANLYGYLNDTHIDTALRQIMTELDQK